MKSPGVGGRRATNRSTSLNMWHVVPESRIDESCNGYVSGSGWFVAILKLVGTSVTLRPSSHSSSAFGTGDGVGVCDCLILGVRVRGLFALLRLS